jgi:TM2 domain-containing membrane protein YozV
MARSHSNALAIGLEVGPGFFFQTFGIGHMYAGRAQAGIAIMLSYWVLQAINVALMSVWIGFVTYPLTMLAYMVLAPTNVIDEKARP